MLGRRGVTGRVCGQRPGDSATARGPGWSWEMAAMSAECRTRNVE
jgi:hypothetical protein